MSAKKVVYTAIFGNYDSLWPVPKRCHCDTRFVCFTDDPKLEPRGWELVVDGSHFNDDFALKNRFYKIFAHQHLTAYEQSLYVDGQVVLRKCPCRLFDTYLSRTSIAIPYHRDRDCIYEEAEYLIRDRKVDADIVRAQMASYRSKEFPAHFGMTENNLVLRRHGDSGLEHAMEMWWQEYSRGARRDQLSLPFVLWKSGIKPLEIIEGPRLSAEYFKLQPHRAQPKGIARRIVWEVIASRHRRRSYGYLAKVFTYLSSLKNLR